MKIFNAGRGCPKCGCKKTFDKYDEGLNQIQRKCTRCDYLWPEKPLDNIEDSQNVNQKQSESLLCPECGSHVIHYSYLDNDNWCDSCHHRFKV